jgi:hypothetical protein
VTRDGSRKGEGRLERMKRGSGMKNELIPRSRGIDILITEDQI